MQISEDRLDVICGIKRKQESVIRNHAIITPAGRSHEFSTSEPTSILWVTLIL